MGIDLITCENCGGTYMDCDAQYVYCNMGGTTTFGHKIIQCCTPEDYDWGDDGALSEDDCPVCVREREKGPLPCAKCCLPANHK